MGIDVYPPAAVAAGTGNVYTRSQTFAPAEKDLTTPDPFGVNANSFIAANVLNNNVALTGVLFSATITGSNGDRFSFQIHPLGAGGSGWTPIAAVDMASGYWDYVHRTYDSGGIYTWLVPAPGANDVRMVRQAGAVGAGVCLANAVASHSAFPSMPKHVGKRDVTLMVRNYVVPAVSTLVTFDMLVAGDDRIRTFTTGQTSRFTSGGKRLWIQGYDLTYMTSGAADRVKVNLVARANGVVTTTESTANSPPVFDVGLLSAPGRALALPEPIELQNSLGGNQGSVGIKAISTSGGVNMLEGTVYCFETL